MKRSPSSYVAQTMTCHGTIPKKVKQELHFHCVWIKN